MYTLATWAVAHTHAWMPQGSGLECGVRGFRVQARSSVTEHTLAPFLFLGKGRLLERNSMQSSRITPIDPDPILCSGNIRNHCIRAVTEYPSNHVLDSGLTVSGNSSRNKGSCFSIRKECRWFSGTRGSAEADMTACISNGSLACHWVTANFPLVLQLPASAVQFGPVYISGVPSTARIIGMVRAYTAVGGHQNVYA